jgi:release factor glutamine methyltransferase
VNSGRGVQRSLPVAPTEGDAAKLFARLLERMEVELQTLPDKPDETPRAALHALWALAEGKRLAPSELERHVPAALDAPAQRELEHLVQRRLEGVPLAHLTGRQDFMGVVLLASPAALIPRRETELLGRAAAERLTAIQAPLMIDVCSGAGNVALGVAKAVPHARVLGADLSRDAVELARANAQFVGRPDVEFRCGDLLTPFAEPAFAAACDMVTCNPPYISTGKVGGMAREISAHEPSLAFDGGPLGVGIIRRVVREAPSLLKAGGWLLMEVGAGQGGSVARMLMGDDRYTSVETLADASGTIRVVAARHTAKAAKP